MHWTARAPVLAGLFGLVVLLGGFAAWATMTQISGAIIAPGRVEVDQNRQVVQHPTGGVVSAIHIEEGDVVSAGDVLIELDDAEMASRLTIVEGQLYELMARRARLEAERDDVRKVSFDPELMDAAARRADIDELMRGQENLFFARLSSIEKQAEQLRQRRVQIENQIDGIVAQEASLAEQLDLIEEQLTDMQSLLDRGLAQASTVLALRREAASLSGRLGELVASRAQARERIAETETQVLQLNSERREEAIAQLRDMRSRELEFVEQRAALLTEIERQQIKAPASGVVYALQVRTLRSVIRGADPVLFIIPQDRPLVISSRVDPIHIDEISTGQAVNLRFSALDQRRTPELKGRVTLVSADAFEDEALGASYYRAEVILEPGELERLDADQTLIPGMPVEAYIRTADRTPLAYLIKPMMDYLNRAFRES